MNWAAMNYVKRLKRESGINGNLRFLFMMIAGRIPKGRVETKPTSLAYYASVTGNDEKTIRNLRDRLLAMGAMVLGEKGRGRKKYQTYVIPALQGPLFMVPEGDEKPESVAGYDPVKVANRSAVKVESLSGSEPEKRQSAAGPVRTSYFRRDVRTKTTTAGSAVVAVICDEALGFLNWAPAVYLQHVRSQITIDYEIDGPRIEKLLGGPPRRSLERIQAMFVVMLTVTVDEDKFLAVAPDRGLRLLAYAADRFERIAVARDAMASSAAARPCHFRHEPPCSNMAACMERERALVAERDASADEATG